MTDELLTCMDCGKQFYRRSHLGFPSSRCPVCRFDAKKKQIKAYQAAQRAAKEATKAKKFCTRCGEDITNSKRTKYCIKCARDVAVERKRIDRHERALLNKIAKKGVDTGAAAETPYTMTSYEKSLLEEAAEKRKWRDQVRTEAREAAKHFDEIVDEAEKRKMSYGQYQAWRRREAAKLVLPDDPLWGVR